jgi:hypothetical protein
MEADDFGVEQESFFDVVRDGEDGDAELFGALLHAGKQNVAQAVVKAGEWLVEEKKFWLWNGERAGKIDALTFAAGEVAGHPVGERGELEEVEDFVDELGRRAVGCVAGEADILTHGQVREEDCALRGIADRAQVRRDAGVAFCVGEQSTCGTQYGTFAAAGGAKDDSPRSDEVDVYAQVKDAEVSVDAQGS